LPAAVLRLLSGVRGGQRIEEIVAADAAMLVDSVPGHALVAVEVEKQDAGQFLHCQIEEICGIRNERR